LPGLQLKPAVGHQGPHPLPGHWEHLCPDGEFFAAALNVQQALTFTPANPMVYGQLGVIYHKSRNYEGAIPALACAIDGCSAEQSCESAGVTGIRIRWFQSRGCRFQAARLCTTSPMVRFSRACTGRVTINVIRAMDVFAQLRSRYAEEPTIMSIVRAGEEICSYSLRTPGEDAAADPGIEMEETIILPPVVEDPEE
jgi:hypothetical protein